MKEDILWLPSWYPNKLSPFNGDFIQRHAQAVSLFNKITVIFIKKDENASITKSIKEITSTVKNLREVIVYYHSLKTGFSFLDKIISAASYRKAYRSILKKYIAQNGKPRLVHVHVALKAGTIALWLKKKFGIPYLLSEHWSGYFKENKEGIDQLNVFQKKWLKRIFDDASRLTVVSKVLGEAITHHFSSLKYQIIPNTVDTSIFFPAENIQNAPPVFMHISALTPEKNPTQIIEAFYVLKQKGHAFRLIIYAPENKEIQSLAEEKDLSGCIEFRKEVSQTVLAKELKKADALILFSHYETFGCVVIEANACGVPVILSDLPVFREYVYEGVNGIFAKPGEAIDLSEKLIEIVSKRHQFNRMKISQNATEKFSYHIVGKKFNQLYKDILNTNEYVI